MTKNSKKNEDVNLDDLFKQMHQNEIKQQETKENSDENSS